MKNSEAHLSIPGSMRILRVELLYVYSFTLKKAQVDSSFQSRNDLIEWCTVKERLFIEGTQITLEQYFDCEAYSPKKTDDIRYVIADQVRPHIYSTKICMLAVIYAYFRVYIACDPYFGHPLIVVILKPFRETPLVCIFLTKKRTPESL